MKEYINEKVEKIVKEKPYYFVCVKGSCVFESFSITECKKQLIKEMKKGLKEEKETFCASEYFIGMYNIDLF